ncbi:hypothetical protein [Desulfonatronovibrio magnus]|uniref:hypothetical protein n=1 Tax=Desulfonatronovibrio magnus TaxID=698827 RepID=UPI0012F8C027|nr:hypothetical protein [Desulfonatronovibrio magnus]
MTEVRRQPRARQCPDYAVIRFAHFTIRAFPLAIIPWRITFQRWKHKPLSPPPPPPAADFLANPEFKAMIRNELSDLMADFIATQEKRAGEVSLIEGIVRVEEAQRSHEQLTRALLEQINLRFEGMQRNMDKRFDAMDKRFESMDKLFDGLGRRLDRFMFWTLGLTVSATFLIINFLR